MASYPVHPRYVPQDPTDQQSLASSIRVLRTSDQHSFLATKIPNITIKAINKPTGETTLVDVILPTAAVSLSRILNHPNIISLVDIIRTSDHDGSTSERGPYGDITVWEDMNAGCLSYLVPSLDSYPEFNDIDSWNSLAAQDFQRFSLPEGLCWHVLKSISHALLWLHYGIKQRKGSRREYLCPDGGWLPILIMDVSPAQIWFKKSTGRETYGECKLGGFQWARVGGSMDDKVASTEKLRDAPVVTQYYWAPEIYEKTHHHSRATEVWMLGATIYTMMTGIPPPRNSEYNWNISRMNDKGFSTGLREIVSDMVKPHPDDRPQGLAWVNRIEDEWLRWRATTTDGQQYIDVTDEILSPLGGQGWVSLV